MLVVMGAERGGACELDGCQDEVTGYSAEANLTLTPTLNPNPNPNPNPNSTPNQVQRGGERRGTTVHLVRVRVRVRV